MNVDDVVAARIEAARIRIQAAKRRREELSAARRRGLAARHAQKLRNLHGRNDRGDAGQQSTTADPVVTQTDTTADPTVVLCTTVAPEKETP